MTSSQSAPDSSRGSLYFVITETRTHLGGITDRLKGAVGLYYVAKQNGLDFRFIHQAGFDIRDYLEPNHVNWSAELSDIPRLPWQKKKIVYSPPHYGELLNLKPGKLYVCRENSGNNILEKTKVPDWQRLWREMFRELFRPSEPVLNALRQYEMPERYAVVNVRFINSLGVSEISRYNAPLPEETQKRLIDAVLEKTDACRKECDVPVVVYSDSVRFLKAAAAHGCRIPPLDGIGHIMNRNISQRVYLDTFVHLFHMSRAEKIYSIRQVEGMPENCLYRSQYPRYAAIIGDIPFIIV